MYFSRTRIKRGFLLDLYTAPTQVQQNKKGLRRFACKPLIYLATRPEFEPETSRLTESQAFQKPYNINGLR